MNLCLILISFSLANLVTPVQKEREEDEEIEIEGETNEDSDTYDENEKKWVKEAVRTVAYYLRSHKFNNYDRRYYIKEPPSQNESNLYSKFVEPPLKYFHWNVFEKCKDSFYSCLRYLYETTVDAYLQRSVDTVYVVRKRNLSFTDDGDEINNVEKECNRLKNLDFDRADPFDGPIEKFQWCITASYYMCWYTMLETVELRRFDEPCDNYANCLQNDNSLGNTDVRADDTVDFRCAMYSFCPDPCCGNKKLLDSVDGCSQSDGNPCSRFNNPTCSFNKTINRSLISMVYNEWNVSCVCQAQGYKWNSRYGLCIDYNECRYDNPCDPETEECVNINQKFVCRCKLRYKWSVKENKCVEEEVLVRALKRFSGIDVDTDEDGCHCIHAGAHLYWGLGIAKNPKHSVAYLIGVACCTTFYFTGFILGFQAANGMSEKLQVVALLIPQINLVLAFCCTFRSRNSLVKLLKQMENNEYRDYVLEQTDITITTKVIRWIILMITVPSVLMLSTVIYFSSLHIPISDKNSLLMPYWFSCGDRGEGGGGFLKSLCHSAKTKSEVIVLNTLMLLAGWSLVVYYASLYFVYILLIVELLKHVELFKIAVSKLVTKMIKLDEVKKKSSVKNQKYKWKMIQLEISISDEFIDIIKYQQFLKNCVLGYVETLKGSNAISITNSFVCTALLLLIVLTEGKNSNFLALNALGTCGLSVASAIFICVCGHLIATMNEMLFDKLCSIPWYQQDVNFRKLYLTALTLNQRSVHVKVFNIYEINLPTILSLIRTAYSVLNMFLVVNS